MILVTGSHGFIGKQMVRALIICGNAVGTADPKGGPTIEQWLSTDLEAIDGVIHLGAVSDTTCEDRFALWATNVGLSGKLANACAKKAIPFIYASSASVYGNGDGPLNTYAASKAEFDALALNSIIMPRSWYGLRFFNVYGSGETHKGKQASMVYQLIGQAQGGAMQIFEPTAARDFVHVDDVVSVMLWMWKNRPASGIYDVGTGEARTFQELTSIVAHAVNPEVTCTVTAMPDSLKGKYQFHTCARLEKLRAVGYTKPFMSLEGGVAAMVSGRLRDANDDRA